MENNRLNQLLILLEKSPTDPFLIYAVGFEYQQAGKEAEAFTYYNQLLADFPQYLPTYYQTGMLLFETGKFDEALEVLNKGISLAMELKDMKTLRELREAVSLVEEDM